MFLSVSSDFRVQQKNNKYRSGLAKIENHVKWAA